MRAPPVAHGENAGPGGAGEPRRAQRGTVSRPSRGGRLFFDRPVAALAGLACRPAIYRRAHRARQAAPVFQPKASEDLTDSGCGLSQSQTRRLDLGELTESDPASSRSAAIPDSCLFPNCHVRLPRNSHPLEVARSHIKTAFFHSFSRLQSLSLACAKSGRPAALPGPLP